ncbi:unnamed protein product [Bemisia tabaci]|uniref:NADH dehydrogenase [ubiquinone] 1 beta subcomplex subunit 5, mitochondrial n=1 Tax=Bemisia tabaci TaxID=7038 RepID=A0A9P0A2X4_BEMTA|nr:unnamed protein product [Bemisia tabaci]
MVAWSSFRPFGSLFSNVAVKLSSATAPANTSRVLVPLRAMSGHRLFEIHPSKYMWVKYKDTTHFYIMIGLIPWVCVITYLNLFIGPAQLAPIPEGYVPKEHEYHRHPLTRFIAQYVVPSTQEEYERTLHVLYEDDEIKAMQDLTRRVEELMAKKKDYKLFWHRPVTTKYHIHSGKKWAKHEEELIGENQSSVP